MSQRAKKQVCGMTIPFVVVVLITMMAGCSSNMKQYENYGERIRIQYPVTWSVQENMMGAVVFFRSPPESGADKFMENFSVHIQDFGDKEVTLEEYNDVVLKNVKKITPGKNILAYGPYEHLQEDAYYVIFTGQQNQFFLKLMQVWMIKDNRAYMLTFTAEERKFERYQKTVEQMIKSLKIM